jgi:hypothetical protein
MDTEQLFDLLVAYHCEKNLPSCLPCVIDGQVRQFPSWGPFVEGEGEVNYYPGLLIISNGPTLVDKLIDNGLARNEDIDDFTIMDSKKSLFDYIEGPGRKDGAHLYDGENQRVARVHEINNSSLQDSSTNDLLDRLPKDFVYSNERSFAGGDIGTKTRLAVKLPMKYGTLEALQIKQTAYGGLGMGKVTHFDKDGLRREFFFDYDKDNENIVGVRREYIKGDLDKGYTEERIPINYALQQNSNVNKPAA